jgi:predicted RecB family nuclease
MSEIFQNKLTAQELMTYKRALARHTQVTSKCHIWIGSHDRHGYGIIYVTFRGKKKIVLAHRLKFYVETMANPLPSQCEVSHRCHTKTCINTDHLSFEPKRVNMARKLCKANGECQGHRGYRRCIL